MEKRNRKRRRVVQQKQSSRQEPLRGIVRMTLALVLVAVAAFGVSSFAGREEKAEIYAAAETDPVQDVQNLESETGESASEVPSGLAGVASGLNGTPSAGSTVSRFGTSYDDVIVGQRTQKISSGVRNMDVSANMESVINSWNAKVVDQSSSASLMSDEDYQNLLQIVEAEAGTEDLKGRILVANVIINRVNYSEFPNTISEVIWEYNNGVAQFSPVSDGRISEVTPSDDTKEAVKQVLEGADYSEGALFFIQKSAAEKSNIEWFDKNLKKLFQHGVHEFYTYPDSSGSTDTAVSADGALSMDIAVSMDSTVSTESAADTGSTDSAGGSTELLQMAKAE